MELEVLKEAVKSAPKGTIHTIVYCKTETRKKLKELNFHKVSTFQVRLSDYEAMSKVKEYRAETGIQPNNPAVQNEVETDVKCIYYNTKQQTYKLRVPLNGTKCTVQYYIGDRDVSKDDYYNEWKALGYTLPSSEPSSTGVEFRSLDVAKIISFK